MNIAMFGGSFNPVHNAHTDFAQKVIDTAEKYQLKYSALAIEVLEDKNITGKARVQLIENIKRLKEKYENL